MTASTKKMPASTTWPTAPSLGPIGMATRTRRYGSRATAGASWKMRRSAPAGTMSSFCANFTPSATSWAQPWKPPAYMGPRRPCMWAITLCSVWPTTRGRTRKTAKTMTRRRATSSASFTASPPGRSSPRVVGVRRRARSSVRRAPRSGSGSAGGCARVGVGFSGRVGRLGRLGSPASGFRGRASAWPWPGLRRRMPGAPGATGRRKRPRPSGLRSGRAPPVLGSGVGRRRSVLRRRARARAGRCDAEPWLTLRDRRGVRARATGGG